jgi:hypothetical protein
MRYEIPVIYFGKSAKNKALVSDVVPKQPSRWVLIDARDDDHAWKQVCALVLTSDKRPISGKSYIRHSRIKNIEDGHPFPADYKVGQRVKLHVPYTGMGSGSFQIGEISEVLSPTVYSIALDGYINRFVDFSTREFVLQEA